MHPSSSTKPHHPIRQAIRLGGLAALLLAIVASAGAAESVPPTALPFDQPALATLRASPKKVFAHYFTQFPISIDNRAPDADYYALQYLTPDGESGKHLAYGGFLRDRPLPQPPLADPAWFQRNLEEEVRRAAAIGLDGFTCDLLAYAGTHRDRAKWLLDAAAAVDPGFRIVLMPDMEALTGTPEQLAALITDLGSCPAAARLTDGRLVVSPFDAQNRSVAWWTSWLATMHAAGIDIAFVPLFQGWQSYAPISAGMSDWGWYWPTQPTWSGVPAAAHAYAPMWMMPVGPQQMRPSQHVYWEAGNSRTLRTMWDHAIQGGADWVQLVTWNDYSEHGHVAPSLNTQHAFYDLSAYYTAWFKAGHAPPITRDVLYYFHRRQSTRANPDPTKQDRLFTVPGGDAPVDEVELLAMLAAPGTLEIANGGTTSRMDAPAGMTSFRVPLKAGRPMFSLLRAGAKVLGVESASLIDDAIVYQDLLYRAGSSSRAPTNGAQPPLATLTSPSPGDAFAASASITLEAMVTAGSAPVAEVAFYDGTRLLGRATAAPYRFAWTGAASGAHRIAAIATDARGITSPAAQVMFTVGLLSGRTGPDTASMTRREGGSRRCGTSSAIAALAVLGCVRGRWRRSRMRYEG